MPSTMEAIMVKNNANSTLPPLSASKPPASFSPIPVRVTIPTIQPATAHATATPMILRAPASRASKNVCSVIRVSLRTILTAIAIKIAIKAERAGV